jgi:CheY-like chemotaxis protein
LTPHTLLIVDDSEDHRFITVTELRRIKTPIPFAVEEVPGALEALNALDRLVKAQHQVLVLCDYRMPRMGGIDLLRATRARHGAKNIRLVVYSSTDQGVA